jgi:hypothetical protein
VMTASDGHVLEDATVDDTITIPPRTAIIGVHAGGNTAVIDGLAGWHERSRVARLNSRVAMGPGCSLQLDGVVTEAQPAWLSAAALLVQATGITTRFVNPVQTVVVLLAGSEAPTPDDIVIELDGATRVADRSGVVRPPRVVMAGDRTALLYDVKPAKTGTVSVHVQPGGHWRLAGVLGGDAESEALSRSLAMKGVAPIAGRLLLAADGAPVAVTWEGPPAVVLPGPFGARRRKSARAEAATASSRTASGRTSGARTRVTTTSAAKKSAAKKSAAKKSTAKKSSAKKSSGRASPAKRSSARTAAVTKPVAKKSAAKKTVHKSSPAKTTSKTRQTRTVTARRKAPGKSTVRTPSARTTTARKTAAGKSTVRTPSTRTTTARTSTVQKRTPTKSTTRGGARNAR